MDTFIAFGAGLSLLLALSELFKKNDPQGRSGSFLERFLKADPFVFVLFFSISIVQFHLYLELSDQLKRHLWFAEVHIPFLFLIGPLAYLYFQKLVGVPRKFLHFSHFVPGALAFTFLLPFFFSGSDLKLEHLQIFPPKEAYSQILFGLLCLGTISNLIYPILLIRKIRNWISFSEKENHATFTPFLILFYGTIFVIFLFVIAQLFFMPLFTIASAALTVLVSGIFLTGSSSPTLISEFEKTAKEARYNQTRLQGLDVDLLIIRMNESMSGQKLFLDEELTLPKLSEHLKIKTHQLSEVLNDRMRISFREYVNRFRLEEASKLLREEAQRSVLSAMYAAGFKSKSAFHKLFQEKYGSSPTEYRKSFHRNS
ncbi:AraC family transcriptional regulator [Leptospira sarikeiensis]|uniref:AraC family transcriptional regulator n=1 Tax=Leptospira sarikeiensis TaxID=2484943 RepID=A0A4R9KC28_9LEPT|nr:helix-turn-helix domain-containing protein [Leptospira sarikeiensis]TGL63435.1 AraC family transcriptional regulator [Leptospira sarikeiensis]